MTTAAIRGHRVGAAIRTMIVVAALAGCAAPAHRPSDPGAVFQVSGTVRTSPACPGPVRLDSPCPDRPLAAARVVATQGTTVVATAVTDAAGHYALDLRTGSYLIVATVVGGYPSRATHAVTVPPDTIVDLTVDSGMR